MKPPELMVDRAARALYAATDQQRSLYDDASQRARDRAQAQARAACQVTLDWLEGAAGPRHLVQITPGGWTIRHPLECRLTGLFTCRYAFVAGRDGIPVGDYERGVYVLDLEDGGDDPMADCLVVGKRVAL